jgi:predicted LPLAT superfamily acyltransferase
MSNNTKKNWADIEEVGVYWLIRFTLFLRIILGGIVFRAVLFPIVTYYFLFNKTARHASLDFLNHVHLFMPHSFIKPTLWYSFKHFMTFAQSIVDKLTAWSGKLAIDDVEIHGREEFYKNIEGKRGALILGGHLGNTEVSRALASMHRRAKLNILVHTKHAQNFNRLLNDISTENQMELIQVSELSPALAIILDQKISQGEFVFIVGDRIPVNNSGRTLAATFLGAEAHFAQGPFILASLLKCPVYTLFCIKQNNKYHVYFDHFADQIKLPRGNREQALQQFVNQFATRLEKYCLLAPLQWFNFYYYWQKPNNNG